MRQTGNRSVLVNEGLGKKKKGSLDLGEPPLNLSVLEKILSILREKQGSVIISSTRISRLQGENSATDSAYPGSRGFGFCVG